MRKFVCLFAIAILFQIIGCKEHLVPPIMNALPEEANVSSTEVLDWDAATKDPSFKNLLDELGELNSGVLTLKGAKKKKKLKLNKSKVKKIKFGKNESFTILIDSLDFTSLKFSNLLLSKNDNKNEAFIVNYYPERSWVASQISHIPSTYKGKIALNRINLEDYTLKTIDCMHVVIYGVIPCTGGPDHVHEGNCNCGDGSDCEPPVRYIIDSDVYCYETHEGGESPAYDSNGSNVPEGGVTGGGASSTGDLDSNDEVIITEGILPYDDNNITAKTLVNDLFGIELGTPADIDIEDFELFDPDSEILIEGKNIAYDDKGGFYFIDKDHLIYYRDGMCYVYINNHY